MPATEQATQHGEAAAELMTGTGSIRVDERKNRLAAPKKCQTSRKLAVFQLFVTYIIVVKTKN